MQELNRRKAPVLIHAAVPNCCNRGFPPGISTGELDFDETRCAQSLLVNGTLTKYPDIKFIIFHAGGVLPVMAGRIKDRYPKDREQWIPNGVWAELRKFYYEIAHGTWRQNLLALKEFVPTRRCCSAPISRRGGWRAQRGGPPVLVFSAGNCRRWSGQLGRRCFRDSSCSLPWLVR